MGATEISKGKMLAIGEGKQAAQKEISRDAGQLEQPRRVANVSDTDGSIADIDQSGRGRAHRLPDGTSSSR